MVLIPGGTTRYGSRDQEETRKLLDAPPEHEIELGSFLIARRETICRELREFSPNLSCGSGGGSIDLPAGGVSWNQAAAYTEWLARSGRVKGARLCTEREWERAARGADGRRYPHGEVLLPGDACTLTPKASAREGAPKAGPDPKARAEAPRGPCPPGSHPLAASLFGVDDLVGNLWEWTRDPPSIQRPTKGVLRGGSWATETDNPWLFSANRGIRPKSSASDVFGIRVCADLARPSGSASGPRGP
jgi:formylglycine-generating enzyme required for sulfatase activity